MRKRTTRERRRERTREALARAAMARFSARGYDATTVDEIVAEAAVSRRTFFRYFPTKDAVVFHRFAERRRRFEELLAAGVPGETRFQAVRRACLAMAEEFMEHREEERARHLVVSSSPALLARELELDAEWEAAMARALSGPDPCPAEAFRARLLAGALMGTIRAALRAWLEGGCADDLRARGEEAFALLEGGVREAWRAEEGG